MTAEYDRAGRVRAMHTATATDTSTISYALIFLFVATYFCLKTDRRPVEIFLLRSRELRNLLVQARLASPTKAHE